MDGDRARAKTLTEVRSASYGLISCNVRLVVVVAVTMATYSCLHRSDDMRRRGRRDAKTWRRRRIFYI